MIQQRPIQLTSNYAQDYERGRLFQRSLQIIESPDITAERGPDGTRLRLRRRPIQSVETTTMEGSQYRLVAVADDYLECVSYSAERTGETWTVTVGSESVYIAKPYHLRCSLTETTVLGKTYDLTYASQIDDNNVIRRKTIRGTSNYEDQIVIPGWEVGVDIIYAIPMAGLKVLDATSNPVKLIMACASRQWAKA